MDKENDVNLEDTPLTNEEVGVILHITSTAVQKRRTRKGKQVITIGDIRRELEHDLKMAQLRLNTLELVCSTKRPLPFDGDSGNGGMG